MNENLSANNIQPNNAGTKGAESVAIIIKSIAIRKKPYPECKENSDIYKLSNFERTKAIAFVPKTKWESCVFIFSLRAGFHLLVVGRLELKKHCCKCHHESPDIEVTSKEERIGRAQEEIICDENHHAKANKHPVNLSYIT